MSEAVVVAHGLGKQFFRKGRDSARYFDAVEPLELTLNAGELTVLMGRSGSGKSTLLNMVGGLLEPTSGTVEVLGRNLYDMDDAELSKFRNEAIGIVPQGQTALHSLTVVQNVMLPLNLHRDTPDAEARALGMLAKLGIERLADSYPSELSGGEARRVSIARALVTNPRVVLADEPTADLDDENTRSVLAMFREAADQGAAVLVVTHESDSRSVADVALALDAGRLGRLPDEPVRCMRRTPRLGQRA